MTITESEPDAAPAALAALVLDEEARRHADQQTRSQTVVLADDLLPGAGEERLPLRAVLRSHGPWLLLVLAAIYLVDELGLVAFQILGPDIQHSLHLSDTGLGAVNSVGSLVFVAAAVPLGHVADRVRRSWLAAGCAAVASVFGALTGLATSTWQLVVARLGNGAGQSAILPVHNSMLADGYPVQGRTRILAAHNISFSMAALLGPLVAGLCAAAAGGGPDAWRPVFVVLGIVGLVLAVVATRLPEPRRGANEWQALGGADVPPDDAALPPELPISFGNAYQRLLKIRTLLFLLVGIGVFGFALAAVPTFFNVLLQRQYHMGAFGRGVAVSLTQAGGLIGVPVGGILGDRLFRDSPPRAILLVAGCLAAYGVVFSASLFLPSLIAVLVGVGLANALLAAATVPIYSFVAAVSPFRLRGLAFALIGVYIFLVGGFLGGVLTGLVSDAHGPRVALAALVPPAALIAAALVAWGSRFVRSDLSAVVAELQEDQEERRRLLVAARPGPTRKRRAAPVPALQVRHVDVSYGPVQVLFDVSFDVREGEVLALLGTNGAGKSTALRAVSGLIVPDRGVVRMGGRTITYVDAETRVGLGLVQVAGGRAVFPSLTVAENLMAGVHSFVWDLGRVRARTDDVLSMFPVLGERLAQPAGLLSGGEQQMLALAKALLLEPRVLLVDELSLGLAPVAVAQLLRAVEDIKASGVTVVIVEQSLNVALSIADRAVFMEKGQVRFEGPAQDLAGRDDLVRAVFLGTEGG